MNLIQTLKAKMDASGLINWKKNIVLKRKQFLKVKGSTDTHLYYVITGSLRIFIEDEYEEHTIRLGYPGSFIAALDSFISEAPSPFYIQAIKACQVQSVPKAQFMELVESDPEVKEIWMQLLGQLIHQSIEREIDVLTFSPRERYNRVLARSPQLFQEIPGKYIASYLRMTPETFSRIKKS